MDVWFPNLPSFFFCNDCLFVHSDSLLKMQISHWVSLQNLRHLLQRIGIRLANSGREPPERMANLLSLWISPLIWPYRAWAGCLGKPLLCIISCSGVSFRSGHALQCTSALHPLRWNILPGVLGWEQQLTRVQYAMGEFLFSCARKSMWEECTLNKNRREVLAEFTEILWCSKWYSILAGTPITGRKPHVN